MKKIIAIALLVASTSVLAQQYQPKCVQQLVCGPAGCYPVVVCW